MPEQDAQKQLNPILTPMFDELRSERIVVRCYRVDDAAALQEAVAESREHIRPWLPFADQHRTVEDSLIWITQQRAAWILRQNMNAGIFEVATGRYLGGLGLMVREWDVPYFEIGYWLRASAEGKGYMSEAVQMLTDYALQELGAKRVEIRCDENNAKSAGVARRLGFVQEGLLHNDFLSPDGKVRNTLIFGMTPEMKQATKA